ncbi:SDR family NAD(P)-dependent oxidoreductase [Ancylobacter dichloromethanicus]
MSVAGGRSGFDALFLLYRINLTRPVKQRFGDKTALRKHPSNHLINMKYNELHCVNTRSLRPGAAEGMSRFALASIGTYVICYIIMEDPDMQRHKGRRVLITGAGNGIGAATARFFAGEGARLYLIDSDAEALAAGLAGLPGEPRP